MRLNGLKISLVIGYYLLLSTNITAQQNKQAILEKVEKGKYLPLDAWLINTDNDTVRFESLRGKWLVVDYWTYGCKPCIKEFPLINALYSTIDTAKLEIINVHVGSKPDKWKKALAKYNLTYPSYYGGWSAENELLAINFQLAKDDGSENIITVTPQYVLISPEGQIIDKWLPKPSDKEFESVLTSYMGAYK